MTYINNSVMSLLKDQISEQQSSAPKMPKMRGKKIVHGKRITPQDLLNNAASTSVACEHCKHNGIVKETTDGFNVIDGIISSVLV